MAKTDSVSRVGRNLNLPLHFAHVAKVLVGDSRATSEIGYAASPVVVDNFGFINVSFDGLLITPPDQWLVFDFIMRCFFSQDAKQNAFPSISQRRPEVHPCPRNLFLLFRFAFSVAQMITHDIKHGNRRITRIIAGTTSLRRRLRSGALPQLLVRRTKHNVCRNGGRDVKRYELLTELAMLASGEMFESAVKQIEVEWLAIAHAPRVSTSAVEPSPQPGHSLRGTPPRRFPPMTLKMLRSPLRQEPQ